MRKVLFICLLFNILTHDADAQIPQYEFKLMFEDAVGRIDSVKFVYDSTIDLISDRKRFGFENITRIPFDKNFEVRCADKGGQDLHSKIMV